MSNTFILSYFSLLILFNSGIFKVVKSMIEEECLKLDAYSYLNFCEKRVIRGVGVVTDKQLVFYSQIFKDDYGTHNDIQIDIEGTIHPRDQRKGWNLVRMHNAYIFSLGSQDFIISLPENGELSKTQLSFLLEVLDQLYRYNNEQKNTNKKVKLSIHSKDGVYTSDNLEESISEIKERLKNHVTQKIFFEEEKIIGKTLNKEEIKRNIKFHIGIKENMNLQELCEVIINAINYTKDSYYKEIFLEMFPNYTKISNLIDIIREFDLFDEKINNINIENAEIILKNIIKGIFSNVKVIDDILNIHNTISYTLNKEEIKTIFPNFDLFLNYYDEIYFSTSEEEKLIINVELEKANSYEEILEIIVKFGYTKKLDKIKRTNEVLNWYEEKLKQNNINKNIIENKEKLVEYTINFKNIIEELSKYEIELQVAMKEIEDENQKINYNNEKISYNTSNIFKKFFLRKQTKICKDNITVSQTRKKQIQSSADLLMEKIKLLKAEIKTLEVKIKEITQSHTLPRSVEEIDNICSKITLIDENIIKGHITSCREDVIKTEKELEMAKKLGIIQIPDQKNSNIPTI